MVNGMTEREGTGDRAQAPVGRRRWCLCPLACCLLLGGCTYRKVISYNAPLAGLPGAVSGREETGDHLRLTDPTTMPGGQIRVENPDGSVVLYSRSPRQLMQHIYQTMENGERDLFVEQVMCARTRAEFRERGYDPGIGFDELVRRRDDVLKLFNAMPQGEYTPGVLWEKLGEKTYRLKVTGLGARDLEWSFMDMVLEHGNWKLRWFGPGT